MLKIRLKRLGAKKAPTYRVIVINSTTKREGRPVQELGHYNPKTKEMKYIQIESKKELNRIYNLMYEDCCICNMTKKEKWDNLISAIM